MCKMLNCGQIVIDKETEEVMVFAGLAIYQCQKMGKCSSSTSFIKKDGTFLRFGDGEEGKPSYTNFRGKDGKPASGSFIGALGLGGVYFGELNKDLLEDKHYESARKAIQEFEDRGWTTKVENDRKIFVLNRG